MILDVIGLTLVALSFFNGYLKGLIAAVFSIVGFLLGMTLSLKLAGKLATFLSSQGWVGSGWSMLAAYLLLLFGVWILVNITGRMLSRFTKAIMLKWADSLLGGIIYALLGAIVWSSLLWVANRLQLISPATLASSKTVTYFEPIAPWVFAHIGVILPYYNTVFETLKGALDGLDKKL